MDIPGLPIGYKNAIAFGGIFIFFDYVLNKISGQIIENENKVVFPSSFFKFLSAGAGFLSGILIVAVLMYCFFQTPLLKGFSGEKEFQTSSSNVLMTVVNTVNFLTFQSVSKEAEKELKSLQILPSNNISADHPESGDKTNQAADQKKTPPEAEKNTPPKPNQNNANLIEDFDF